jgi:hypothetical protein
MNVVWIYDLIRKVKNDSSAVAISAMDKNKQPFGRLLLV